MAIVPILFDSRPKYLEDAGSRATLLALPLGCGTLLDMVTSCLAVVEAEPPRVVPPDGVGRQYPAMVRRHGGDRATVWSRTDLLALAEALEPGDVLLLIDPRYWPAGGLELDAALDHFHEQKAVIHAVEGSAGVDCAIENVRFDNHGCIRAVRRFYHGVTWPDVGQLCYSLVPPDVLNGPVSHDLAALRATLAANGVVTRDFPLSSSVLNLERRSTMLAFGERILSETQAGRVPPGYVESSPDIWVGRGVRVHREARVIGPVVLQHGCAVQRGATIIGPCTIGEGVVVGERVMVAQSILASCLTVPANDTVRHLVLSGDLRNGVESYVKRVSFDEESWGTPEPIAPDAIPPSPGRAMRRFEVAMVFKRAIDILGAVVGLILFAPLMVMVAALIRFESRGRVFYGQEREGRDGKMFRCWKFRTMTEGAHALQRELQELNGVDGPQFKMANDPRVTRVGRWLRATNIDELPQFWNVLVGQMSLVGPRPSPFRENQICVPWRRARLSVRPGITGLWQVCRHNRSEGDFHQWIAYDTLYVRHHTLGLDIRILLATLLTLGGKWSVPLEWMIGRHAGRAAPREVVESSPVLTA